MEEIFVAYTIIKINLLLLKIISNKYQIILKIKLSISIK